MPSEVCRRPITEQPISEVAGCLVEYAKDKIDISEPITRIIDNPGSASVGDYWEVISVSLSCLFLFIFIAIFAAWLQSWEQERNDRKKSIR